MPRRILLLITDLQIGGTPTVVRELAVRLADDPDFYVHVACLDRWGPVADQLKTRGVAVTALNACGAVDARVLFRLIRLIRREKFETVFSFLIHANALAATASFFVRDVRFLQSIQTSQRYPKWHWRLQQLIQNRAEKIVVPSVSVKEAAIQWAAVPDQKLLIIPNAVDIARFQKVPRLAIGKRVGFIGRLDPVKRVDDLVSALSILEPDFTLDIFGDGTERPKIQDMILRLNLDARVKLHGAIAQPETALAAIDALVLPSDSEGFGLVLIEAMAAGVPVIGTNVPGIRDVIEDRVSGLLVPPRNPASLAEAIRDVLSDGTLRNKFTTGGRDRVRRLYDWPVCYAAYRKLLNESIVL